MTLRRNYYSFKWKIWKRYLDPSTKLFSCIIKQYIYLSRFGRIMNHFAKFFRIQMNHWSFQSLIIHDYVSDKVFMVSLQSRRPNPTFPYPIPKSSFLLFSPLPTPVVVRMNIATVAASVWTARTTPDADFPWNSYGCLENLSLEREIWNRSAAGIVLTIVCVRPFIEIRTNFVFLFHL